MKTRPAVLLSGLAALLCVGAGPSFGTRPGKLPPIVFVSRQPAPTHGGMANGSSVPGLGPMDRALAPGGTLLQRDRDGRIRPLLPAGRFFDVSDPCASWDARRLVFAATTAPDSAWRLYVMNADGSAVAALTRSDRSIDPAAAGFDRQRGARYDDLDPCWLPDGRVCFASTRFPQRAERCDVPVTNLFVVEADGSHLQRITSERNGAEEPSIDPRTGRVVYARWLFNRYLPSDGEPGGLTLDPARAVPRDPIDLWEAISATPDGDGIRLAGGDPRTHATMVAYEPVILRDGTLVGVRADNGSLAPEYADLGLVAFPKGFATPRALAGAGSNLGGSACSPEALPDGRLLFAWDPGATGDFGLYVTRQDGSHVALVTDLPGTLELDAVALVPRTPPPVLAPEEREIPIPALPHTEARQLSDSTYTFRFDCANVFTNAPVDAAFPDAPPLGRDLRIRFFGALARPQTAGGDTVVLIRESRVDQSGAVHEHDLPADTPMFEQLVDAQGHLLRSAHGPAQVPGFNFARFGSGTKCVGCHAGHSAIPAPVNNWAAKWFNVSPSADVQVSSMSAGSSQGLIDRRARGPAEQVGWVAQGRLDESVRLLWHTIVEVRTLVVYCVSPEPSAGTNLRVGETEIVFFRGGREAKRLEVRRPLSPLGTRIDCEPVRVDAVEIRLSRISGTVRHRSAAALAEVEIIARLIED